MTNNGTSNASFQFSRMVRSWCDLILQLELYEINFVLLTSFSERLGLMHSSYKKHQWPSDNMTNRIKFVLKGLGVITTRRID